MNSYDANTTLHAYASQSLFLDASTWEMTKRPYHRSLRPQALGPVDLNAPLTADAFMNYEALAAQRILTTVYEQDMVLLPKSPYDNWRQDFDLFYSPEARKLAGMVRQDLERYVFGYLEETVEVSSGWTREAFLDFLSTKTARTGDVPRWAKTIQGSRDRVRAAKMWLVQFAPDFLSEASPMLKNVLGNYGPIQSEWFNVIIDEYGYGVHEKKHSTLFERTLESVDLDSELHYYWQYYLASALAANNFFHYLGSEHRNFFRYAGALVMTESTLVEFCEHACDVLNDVFDNQCDVEYFSEHCHIDQHHGRMAREKICLALIDHYGEAIIPDMVWGMLAYERLMDDFDEQFAIQIEWMDTQEDMFSLHKQIAPKVLADDSVPVADLDEHFNELSNSHCHNGDELCHIEAGEMYFFSGLDSQLILGPGDGVVIRNRRQHGADILSDSCQYKIYTIGDVAAWQ
ncbi:iron-containing redox enzyme family protein [Janibacter sp. G368]|uniref:iron-containing redox enzyme family protein n=1 Tax=Janibacter sp. G368 TaxID=3420441 RepID=UPI003D051C75